MSEIRKLQYWGGHAPSSSKRFSRPKTIYDSTSVRRSGKPRSSKVQRQVVPSPRSTSVLPRLRHGHNKEQPVPVPARAQSESNLQNPSVEIISVPVPKLFINGDIPAALLAQQAGHITRSIFQAPSTVFHCLRAAVCACPGGAEELSKATDSAACLGILRRLGADASFQEQLCVATMVPTLYPPQVYANMCGGDAVALISAEGRAVQAGDLVRIVR
jgi:hypothetical protein